MQYNFEIDNLRGGSMKRDLVYALLAVFIIASIAGCSTVPKKKYEQEMGGVKAKVETLETRVEGVETKQAEVERATSEQGQALEDLKAHKERVIQTNISTRTKVSSKTKEGVKDIQACLKNAGFYNGKIDGVKGRSTKKAIKEFQKANGLKADGRVGPKTWELLNKYASGPVQGTAVAEEGASTK